MKDHREEWEILCAKAAVEQDPQKLLNYVKRINELLEAKRARLQGRTLVDVERRGKRVFQIAYEELRLISRAEILKQRGYDVVSVLGNEDALRGLAKGEQYRIFLIGHNAPKKERQEIVRWIKANFPGAKILALNPPKNGGLPEADFNFVINGPEEWLAAISSAA